MFFDLEDYASQYRETINPACVDPNIPKVDNSSVECDQVISSNCVVTPKGFPYLGIGSGETITSVIEKIKEKFKSISFTIQNLGSGIGILKGFSGGVLTAKTIAAGNNIQLTEANDTITIGAIVEEKVVNITHSELVILKNGNELKPGTFYRITDFRTMYDQPDFDANGAPKTSVAAKVGPIEPIIVLALTNSTLSSKAYQEAYPDDTIEYMLQFTTPVNNTVTKGRIIYRKDEWGNETDFDHRNVLFKRYLHPQIQANISYTDTSLTSVEKYTFNLSSNDKSTSNTLKGYFKLFQSGNLVFDLPNVTISYSKDSIFGSEVSNSTFEVVTSSVISYCSKSCFYTKVLNSKIRRVVSSTIYSSNIGGNPVGIDSCIIKEIFDSIINAKEVVGCNITTIDSVNFADFRAISSEFGIIYSGLQGLQNNFPVGNYFEISNSKISGDSSSSSFEGIEQINGNCTIRNCSLSNIGGIVFLDNKLENIRGNKFGSNIMKQGQNIEHLNILGDVISIDFSTSTIIYDTTLSKEIIKHPNGLYIKHYDQFGAAVINNVNA